MSISDSLQDFIGKYSVTGVLRERLEFESSQTAALREQVSNLTISFQQQLADKDVTIAKLSSEKEVLKLRFQKAEAELKQLHSSAPPMDLEMGAEIVLGQLSARPSGCTIVAICSVFNTPKPEDAACWIDEFIEHGFVERVDLSDPPTFRLTAAGRSYARKYFAPRK